ncbi:MAG: hypothetical protein WCA12_07650, partial [Burkholderiales bacterium]
AAVSLAAPSLAQEKMLKVGVTAGPHAQIFVQTESRFPTFAIAAPRRLPSVVRSEPRLRGAFLHINTGNLVRRVVRLQVTD